MTQQALNVLGTALVPCSFDPLTGFYRDGCCNTDELDRGLHVVCARMTASGSAAARCDNLCPESAY
jgi:uncharacterized protein (DUF2237 family)